jgi:hypothetical protein
MAIIDSTLEFCDAQSIAGVASYSCGSTNSINLGTGYNCWDDTKYNDLGEPKDLVLNVQVATDFAPVSLSATAAITIYLKTATSAAVAKTVSGTTVRSWAFAGSALTGSLVAGQQLLREKIPSTYNVNGVETPLSQYIGLWFANCATAITAGAIDAWIGMDSETPAPKS